MKSNQSPGAIKRSAMSNLNPRWPTSYEDYCLRFDPTKPYPRYILPESTSDDAPPSPGGSRGSTPLPSPLPPSYEWTATSSFDQTNGDFSTEPQSPAFQHPAADKEESRTRENEIATGPSTPYIERTCKRKMKEEVRA